MEGRMKYFPKLTGPRVYLSPISLEDAETYTRWLNDLAVTRYLTLAPKQMSLQAERDALASLSRAHNYAIVLKEGDELLGNIGLMDVDSVDGTAEVGLFIGESSRQGKGYGTEALRLLCDYGFNVLRLSNIMLRTADFNGRAQACYRKVGFREIGRRHDSHFYAGSFHDTVYMELLARDFGASVIPGTKD
jgi:RimJ/RimL family protein N-acetyltransferase